MQKYAIIVAGGSGTRMRSQLPKQFITVAGKPILMHTLKAFDFDDIQLILVLPQQQISFWRELCQKNTFFLPHKIVEGGASRFESVRNGLNSIETQDGLVAIHDGVRPIIKKEIIKKTFEKASETGNAITAVPLKDSIREVNDSSNKAKDRANYRLVQTPQTFLIQRIKDAFDRATHTNFTDDASVLEAMGEEIHLIEGDYRNIKITTQEDLLIAESYLEA